MKKNIFEIYLTSQYVLPEEWLNLFLRMSKINRLFKPWNLWIHIENNYIRYFIETTRMLPPVLGELGGFLFKKSDITLKEKFTIYLPFLVTSNYKTVLDVYDKNETKRLHKLKDVKITFYPHKYDSYLTTTNLYFKTEDGRILQRKAFWNSTIHEFVSVDFGIHTRFFYQKETARYLETKKVINLLNGDKERAI